MRNAYLSVDDVAQRFGVNSTTVYRLAQRGRLPAFKIGNQWRFSEEMLEAWVSEQTAAERTRLQTRRRGGRAARE